MYVHMSKQFKYQITHQILFILTIDHNFVMPVL